MMINRVMKHRIQNRARDAKIVINHLSITVNRVVMKYIFGIGMKTSIELSNLNVISLS